MPRQDLVGRAEQLAALRRSLQPRPGATAGAGAGAVLVGAPGLGKTSLLNATQESLPGEYFVRVRGLRPAASSPYRALNFLLSQLPEDLAHPALLPTALTAYLRAQAAGRPLVFAVDNGEHVDAESATLIGQLVANGTARLLMAVRDFARLDPVFSALWRGGALTRLDLTPLSVVDTRHLAEADLGAPVSREVLDEVWDAAHGNPHTSRETLRRLVDSGVVARRGPAWVLLGTTPRENTVMVAGTADAATTADGATASGPARVSVLPPSEREALTLLALAGPSPWAHLIRLVDAQDLDALQGRGLLTMELQRQPVFSVSDHRRERRLIEETSPAEAAALHARYTTVSGAARQLEAQPVRRVVWALRAGLPVTEEQLVAALTTLNDDGRYAEATDLLRLSRNDDGAVAPAVALQGAVAALGQGRHRAAEILGLSLATVGEQPDVILWVQCRIQLARIQRRHSGANAGTCLKATAGRLAVLRDTADAVVLPELTRLGLVLGTERAELASFDGRYRENLEAVPALLSGLPAVATSREDRELQVTLQSLLLEAHALVDQRPADTALLHSFATNLSSPEVAHRVADAALQRVEFAALLTGGRSAGHGPVEEVGLQERWSVRRGSQAELMEALTLLSEDRPRDAARVLGPVVEQLRELDPHGLLPAAAAGLTFCHTRSASAEQQIIPLTLSGGGEGRPWIIRRAALHYQLLSSTQAGDREEAARRLQECAADDLASGATSWALVTLTAAVRLGRLEALEELRRVADTLQGPLARIGGLYAQALLEADRSVLLQAIEAAVDAKSYRLARDIARSGIAAATQAEDRMGVRYLQRALRGLLPEGFGRAEAYASFEGLTAREREIALLTAAGHSNKVIAEQLFVSVRTVEGHLYQVYSKLNVSTRAELIECIPPRAAP